MYFFPVLRPIGGKVQHKEKKMQKNTGRHQIRVAARPFITNGLNKTQHKEKQNIA